MALYRNAGVLVWGMMIVPEHVVVVIVVVGIGVVIVVVSVGVL